MPEPCGMGMRMQGWDAGWISGYSGISWAPATAVTVDLLSGRQDNSHPGWFSSQVNPLPV